MSHTPAPPVSKIIVEPATPLHFTLVIMEEEVEDQQQEDKEIVTNSIVHFLESTSSAGTRYSRLAR